LLRAVAQRLRSSVRQSDTVARIGGDEFVIVLDTVRKSGEGETVANHVRRALAKPITILQHPMTVTASIGISFYPENGESADMLLRAADSAMYLAKKGGGNRHVTAPPGLHHPDEVLEKR
jgi:diguanylate cyclase (GGDEF)-like protein